jgi:hypothetical protein
VPMAVDRYHLLVLARITYAVKTRQETMDDCTPTYDEHAKRAEVHFACLES